MGGEIASLGTHFIVGLMGTSLLQKERELLKELKPAGIIIFRRNIGDDSDWQNALTRLMNECRELTQRERFFTSIDHEGGRVHRLKPPVTHFPPASQWKGETFYVGQTMGEELHQLGFNLDFAPVLDVNSEPRNTVIGDRSFGCAPNEVIQRAKEFINGLQSKGVLACGKHFPGHGGTVQDSHFELPVRDCSISELRETDLAPFRDMTGKSLQLLMTAHVLYPALDTQMPATLSSAVLTNLLRGDLGFTGAIVSDALEMKALAELDPAAVIQHAFKAGVDLNLAAEPKEKSPLELACELAGHAAACVNRGDLEESILEASRSRIDEVFNFLETLG